MSMPNAIYSGNQDTWNWLLYKLMKYDTLMSESMQLVDMSRPQGIMRE